MKKFVAVLAAVAMLTSGCVAAGSDPDHPKYVKCVR